MSREVAIVDYGGGNVQSVAFALDRLGATSVLTADPDLVASASHVIFPGQGRADRAMAALRERGLDAALLSRKLPTLGICIGQQLMCAHSEEGDTTALGVFAERCVKFGEIEGLKVPHMGWNTVREVRGALFDAADEGSYFYFVHSYYLQLGPHSTATCHYGGGFAAATERDNFFAVQFHPEKSGAAGERLLRRFLTL